MAEWSIAARLPETCEATRRRTLPGEDLNKRVAARAALRAATPSALCLIRWLKCINRRLLGVGHGIRKHARLRISRIGAARAAAAVGGRGGLGIGAIIVVFAISYFTGISPQVLMSGAEMVADAAVSSAAAVTTPPIRTIRCASSSLM